MLKTALETIARNPWDSALLESVANQALAFADAEAGRWWTRSCLEALSMLGFESDEGETARRGAAAEYQKFARTAGVVLTLRA